MGEKLDFKGLAQDLLARVDSLLAAWLPGGKKEGREYVAVNPSRGDAKPGSFKVNMRTGKWSDFATGDSGGDLTSLYQYLRGIDAKTAYTDLRGPEVKKIEYAQNKGNEKPAAFQETVEAFPVPDDAPLMPLPKGRVLETQYTCPETGEALYPITYYKDIKGKIIYRVITTRNKTLDRKFPKPTSWCRWVREGQKWNEETKEYINTGKIIDTTAWNNKDWPDHRPLLGLDYLFRRIHAPVLIVEGEKKWASAISRLPDYAVISWRGGAKAVAKTDWAILAGRDVIIWPDYDEPGHRAALQIANILKRQDCNVRICWEPLNIAAHPEGWDLADVKNVDDVKKYIKDYAVFLTNVEALIEEENNQNETASDIDMPEYNNLLNTIAGTLLQEQKDLRCLGYSKDNKNYYISRQRGVVVALSPDQLGNINHLLSLMPLYFWYKLFPSANGGLNKHDCANSLHRWAEIKGYFNPDTIRGAGVWVEKDGSHVLHMGQKLLVDGKIIEINEFASSYMYEATSDVGIRQVKPLANKDAKKLLELCEWLSWDAPIYAKLLAGFAAVAPMCGGLDWRPHIWLTGSAGSGKTTVISKILYRVCGAMSLFVQGDSTAAGIRQRLGSDALPVIFDEFEGDSPRRLEELTKILDLARQASSESGALMLKGSAGGDAVEFRIRSCFAFSAINVNLRQYADRTRTTVLTLQEPPKNQTEDLKNERINNYQNYERLVKETLTTDYVNALQIRTFNLLPVIKANAKIFGSAVQRLRNSAREGDQLGILCAGAYSLEHYDIIDEEVAEAWVKQQDWVKSSDVDESKDHDRCLAHMMQYLLRIQAEGHYLQRTVGELISMVLSRHALEKEADGELKRYGFRVERDEKIVWVANNHTKLSEIMGNSAYHSWSRLLTRCDGAKPSTSSIRFSSGVKERAIGLPLSTAFNNAEDKPELDF